MEKNKAAEWQTKPSFNEVENLMGNMNEALEIFTQILKEKRVQLISMNNKLKEQENGRTTMGS